MSEAATTAFQAPSTPIAYVDCGRFADAVHLEILAERESYLSEAAMEMDEQIRMGIAAGPMVVTEHLPSSPIQPQSLAIATPIPGIPCSMGKYETGSKLKHCAPDTIFKLKKNDTISWRLTPEQAVHQVNGRLPDKTPAVGTQLFFRSPYTDFLTTFRKVLRERSAETWPSAPLPPLQFGSLTLTSGPTAREKALAACLDDRNPLLMVKGPPGTGKTHLLAEVAGTLVRSGKRVLICAVAHAAVDNALNAIRAQFPGLPVTKHPEKKDSFSKDLVGATNAAAIIKLGIAPFDVLILDEAGQIPAFAAAALAPLGDRLLLFGDESQLPCILKAQHHPRYHGASSAMDYLKAVLPPDYLLPLDRTWRMNSTICSLIQRHFYPDIPSLQPAAGANANAHLIAPDGSPLPALRQIQVKHDRPRLTHSPEEIAVLLPYLHELLQCAVQLGSADPRPMQATDIAILCPYRQQTQAIRQALDADSTLKDIELIGTVDKMQGQGAPVLIYCLATSSPDQLNNLAEWIFSSNRWNVALSRAKVHAVVLGDLTSHLNATPTTIPGWNAQRTIRKLIEDQAWEV